MTVGLRGQLAAACLVAVISALALPLLAHARTQQIDSIAYAFLLNRHGGWTGPETVAGVPESWVADRVIAAHPSHLRVTDAASTCTHSECYTLQPNSVAVALQLRRMRDAGIKLGAAINIARSDHGRRSISDVVDHACRIKQADRENLYSWLFLDFSSSQPKRFEIATKIKRGTGCDAGGWNVITNSSGYKKSYRLVRGALGHAKRFSLLVGGSDSAIKERLIDAAEGRRSTLTDDDRRFLKDVKRKYPGADPMLKLEVPHQTGRIFAELPGRVQRSLLEKWARGQRRHGYKMVFPLFVFPGNQPSYNSLAEGTYELMVDLMGLGA